MQKKDSLELKFNTYYDYYFLKLWHVNLNIIQIVKKH